MGNYWIHHRLLALERHVSTFAELLKAIQDYYLRHNKTTELQLTVLQFIPPLLDNKIKISFSNSNNIDGNASQKDENNTCQSNKSPTTRVRFVEKFVSDVKYRPRTSVEDKACLFYQKMTLRSSVMKSMLIKLTRFNQGY
jgi:hypothetical protein